MSNDFEYIEPYIYVKGDKPQYKVQAGGVTRMRNGTRYKQSLNQIIEEEVVARNIEEVSEQQWNKLLLMVAAEQARLYKTPLRY